MPAMDEIDKKLLNILQNDFPISIEPYRDIANLLCLSEEEIMQRIVHLQETGIIRRIGAVLDARKMGFYSTLCAMAVPAEQIEQASTRINAEPGVTHNYLRSNFYNLWFTLTAPSREEADKIIANLRDDLGPGILSLPAARIYKIKVVFEMGGTNEL